MHQGIEQLENNKGFLGTPENIVVLRTKMKVML
jgi:hypothetical protein